jgi:hypothetical protein
VNSVGTEGAKKHGNGEDGVNLRWSTGKKDLAL